MKSWFPFTDYDFYGYLVSGFALLFALDYTFTGGEILLRENWTFIQIVLAIGVAYFAGQLIAYPSSLILEHFLACTILKDPTQVLLMEEKPSWTTRFIGRYVGGRNYRPLPHTLQNKIIKHAAKDLKTTPAEIRKKPGLVFRAAFHSTQENEIVRQRLNVFLNQYGLNRNMAFTTLVTSGLFFWQSQNTWAILALIFFLGLFARFLKFYATYTAEILQHYSFIKEK